ncbi:MAG TPA: hypothetical protein DCG12_12640 [Planctomycetaceae bacterium]|nr:hypothetical protein [Planctomycetaceae bacterium]
MAAAALLLVSGCASPLVNHTNSQPRMLQIPATQQDLMWERAVSVLHDNHFSIARESKIEGIIESDYRAGSGLFEPWHRDSIGYASRVESTLQSIRRRVLVTFQQSSDGQILVSVRVEKEVEDVPVDNELQANGVISETDSSGSRWLPRGTDPLLEAWLLEQIRDFR